MLEQMRQQLTRANRLYSRNDYLDRILAYNLYDEVRQTINRGEIQQADVIDLLPSGYQRKEKSHGK